MVGGLTRQLPTHKSLSALRQRAREYIPITNCINFDAVDVAALAVGNGSVDWETLKAVAERLMELLHLLWSTCGPDSFNFLLGSEAKLGYLK